MFFNGLKIFDELRRSGPGSFHEEHEHHLFVKFGHKSSSITPHTSLQHLYDSQQGSTCALYIWNNVTMGQSYHGVVGMEIICQEQINLKCFLSLY